MLATPHILAGAALGKTLKRAWLAVPAAFALHFLLDAVPHLGTNGMFDTGGHTTPALVIAALIDTMLGIGLVCWCAVKDPARNVMLAAAFAGILVDVAYYVPPWGTWLKLWPPSAHLDTFHHAIQWNVPRLDWPLGIGTQAMLVVGVIWLIKLWRVKPAPLP